MSHHLEVIQISMQLTSHAGLAQVLSYPIFLLVLISPTHRGMEAESTCGVQHSWAQSCITLWSNAGRTVTHPCINQAHDCLTSVIKRKTFAPCYVSPLTFQYMAKRFILMRCIQLLSSTHLCNT